MQYGEDNVQELSGSKRVRKPRQQPVSFKAPREIREQIAAMANATGMSKGGVIKAAISSHFDQMMRI